MGIRKPLEQELILSNIPEVSHVCLAYRVNSMMFATLFDFVLCFSFPGKGDEDAELLFRHDTFCFERRGFSFRKLQGFPNELAIARIEELGVTDIRARYLADNKMWYVDMTSLVGSSTWNLLPPILQLIEPRLTECVRMIELIRIIAAVLYDADVGN